MSDSTTLTSWVTVLAFPYDQILKHKSKDVMLICVTIVSEVVTTNPVTVPCSLKCMSFRRDFEYPVHDFFSVKKGGIIMSKIIQDLKIPFPLENTNWGCHNFPTTPTPENLGIITGRLSKIARDCVTKNNYPRGPCMHIHFRKVEKVSLEEYQKQDENMVLLKHPFVDWLTENPEVGGKYIRIIQRLGYECRKKNDYFGMKSTTIEEDDVRLFGAFDEEEIMCCSICIKELERGKQAIRMPCSHVFHGTCILRWISNSPTCPICRFELSNSTPPRS